MQTQRQHRLMVVEGPDPGHVYPLQGMVVTLGRAADNTIVFDSSRISRRHAQIRLLPRGAMIEDLDSTNGTWVNGKRLTEDRLLTSGDMVRLADYVTLRYIVKVVAQAPPAVPGPSEEVSTRATEERELAIEPQADEAAEAEAEASAAPYTPVPEAVSPDVRPTSSVSEEAGVIEAEESTRRPRSLYVLVGILALLICLCIASAVYIWFAPVEFWERVFDLFNIPMPSGTLSTLPRFLMPTAV